MTSALFPHSSYYPIPRPLLRFFPALTVILLFFGTALEAAGADTAVGSDTCPVLLSMLDSPPRPILQKVAPYPEEWKKQGIAGGVLLRYVVDAQGRVIDIRILHSTDPRFNEMCISMVKGWKFQPALFEGAPVAFSVVQPIAYAATPEERRKLTETLQKEDSIVDTQLDNKPKATHVVDPDYPKGESRTTTLTATAVIVVDEEGRVRDVGIRGSDLSRAFRIEIQRSLLQWNFEKGLKDGKVVSWRAEVMYIINPRGPDGKLLNPPTLFDKPLIMTMSSVLPLKDVK
jgi:TonB family protein